MVVRYEPANSFESPRFSGVRTFARLPNARDLENADAAVVGAPFDTGTTFRVGARFGPEGVRSVSHLLRPYNPSQGVPVFELLSAIDYGDVPVVPGYIEASYRRIAEGLRPMHEAGVVPVVLGGDHSIALPEAAAVHAPSRSCSSTPTLTPGTSTSASATTTPASSGGRSRRACSTPRARSRSGCGSTVRPRRLGWLQGVGLRPGPHRRGARARDRGHPLAHPEAGRRSQSIRILRRGLRGPRLRPRHPGGRRLRQLGGLRFLRGLAGLRIVGCDVVEIYPAYDPAQITAFLGAAAAYEMLTLIAIGPEEARQRGRR